MVRRNFAVGAILMLILILILSVFVPEQSHDHFWEKIPGFEAIFGFLGCLIIILVSKALGHLFIQKREDYYDE